MLLSELFSPEEQRQLIEGARVDLRRIADALELIANNGQASFAISSRLAEISLALTNAARKENRNR